MLKSGLIDQHHKHSPELSFQRTAEGFHRNAAANSVIGITVALAATLSPTVAHAQGILGAILSGIARNSRQQTAQNRAPDEALRRVSSDINVAPDAACKIPSTDIERWLREHVNDQGLMDNVARTVFHEEPNAPSQDGYEALLQRTREETAKKYARSKATQRALETGQQVPVGGTPAAAPPDYRIRLTDMKAESRIQNGLDCSANVAVDALRFGIAYSFTLDPSQPNGWDVELRFPLFTEAEALAEPPQFRIAYGDSELSLAQARKQSEIDIANRDAATAKARQQKLAEEAYRNSPAGRAQAALTVRALSAEYKRRGLACQNSGGTWGSPWDSHTVQEVTPGIVPDELTRLTLGCYHL